MSRLVIIQHIETHWSRQLGNEAAKRNAVPETVKLPAIHHASQARPFAYHHLVYRANYDQPSLSYSSPFREILTSDHEEPFRVGGVIVAWTSDLVTASFQYNISCGAPERGWARKTMSLSPEQWGQFVYNGRFSYNEGSWTYKKTVVNVGLFDNFAPSLFTESEPNKRFSAMAHLF